MNTKSTDFLFGCRNLYLLKIHPFDFSKSKSKEYQRILELGKKIIKQNGVQEFAGFLMEYQYRVATWTAFICLEFGEPYKRDKLKYTVQESLFLTCLEQVEKNEILELPTEIIENRNRWINKIKTCYNTM